MEFFYRLCLKSITKPGFSSYFSEYGTGQYFRTKHPYGLNSITFSRLVSSSGICLPEAPENNLFLTDLIQKFHGFYKPAFKEFSVRAEIQIREME